MHTPKILIVEDSRSVRNLLSRILNADGAETVLAEDGQEGLELARQGGFDLIITDVDMPRMNGFELCRELKTLKAVQGTPVIILSARDEEEDVDRGFEVGAAAFLNKTMEKSIILERVHELLHESSFRSRRTVLVVDDSRVVLRVVTDGLRSAGFRVLASTDGAQALDLFREQKPDLVLSGLKLKSINGPALCDYVRLQGNDQSDTPFVVMSSAQDRETMRHLLRRGASAFLVKPFDVDQMVILVEKLLSDHYRMRLREEERLKREQRLMLEAITSLAQALEARDSYTHGHSERVSELSVVVGRRMGLEEAELQRLAVAARLHDIGKIGVSDAILRKNGKLDNDEYARVKRHPEIGCDILRPVDSLRDAVDVVRHHHERMDGKGYPDGLAGEAIPLWARIVAVCDVYEALTSERPYRQAMDRERALEIVQKGVGSHFDPVCAEAFFASLEELEP